MSARSANLNSFALDPRGQGSSPSDCLKSPKPGEKESLMMMII